MTDMKLARHSDTRSLSDRPYGWMDQANCRDLPGFINLPTARQREICGTCPVREQCADWSPIDAIVAGMPTYGGLDAAGQLAHKRKPRPCPKGHDKTVCGVDSTGWCKDCRRELNRRYKARKKAEQ